MHDPKPAPALITKKIFGTDGVRGTANVEPVTAETALKLGRAAGHVFKNLAREDRTRIRHKIVLGKDTRLSGYMLENALSSGILSMGVDVFAARAHALALVYGAGFALADDVIATLKKVEPA